MRMTKYREAEVLRGANLNMKGERVGLTLTMGSILRMMTDCTMHLMTTIPEV
jgi:hypothetical protein